jgi:pimeloyl-ACP methyl ester carboxylesterase
LGSGPGRAGSPLEVEVLGSGPRLILVHGGAGPAETWELQHELSLRWELWIPRRRGFGASPPGPQDFEVDASDLLALVGDSPAHVVGFSYGGVGVAVAAAASPASFVSLTIIEAPLYFVAADDPEVQHLEAISNEFLRDGFDAPDAVVREFLATAAFPLPPGVAPPPAVVALVDAARGGRVPGEATPDLEAARAAGLRSLVVSGDHSPAIERICDGVAARLGAGRAVLPGRGHAVMRVPGFNDLLERFLRGE